MELQGVVMAIVGGALIGTSASVLLVLIGRVAGISSIVGGLIRPSSGETAWKAAFLVGLLVGGAVLAWLTPGVFGVPTGRSLPALGAAGLLVGLGTRLGSGCTSGHGICGLTRLSVRSLVATCVFMGGGMAVATTLRLVTGGVL